MAQSPSHKFGQIMGDFLELAMAQPLQEFADKHGLYLDKAGKRKARKGKKVSWVDSFKNKHDLDFVLERGGSETIIGTPVAFIESAWRRYTKHSRNKAQEIQGAILPLSVTHSNSAPFLGVILGGVYTSGAITQLGSSGFEILHFNYDLVLKAFSEFGLDASSEEDTTIEEFHEKIKKWEACDQKDEVAAKLLELGKQEVETFMEALRMSVERYIVEVRVLPLYGQEQILYSVEDALKFLNDEDFSTREKYELTRFEVKVVYNNGDKIEAGFSTCTNAINFLKTFEDTGFQPQ